MAGHSKWKNIQHRKGSQDQKRAKMFTKVGLELQVASRQGGTDPAANPRLRTAIAKARSVNMSKDIIERNIQRGQSRSSGADSYKQTTYEGYGPGGVALMVECLTDNVNRTASEIRYIFSRGRAEMVGRGAVSWMFSRRGYLLFRELSSEQHEQLWEQAVALGADEIMEGVDEDGDLLAVYTPADGLAACREALEVITPPDEDELIWYPTTTVAISPEDQQRLASLLETLEDNQDVQGVFDNSAAAVAAEAG